MSTIQEFSYSNTSQRKIIYLNSFFSAAIIAVIAVEIIMGASLYLPYFPAGSYVFLSILTGLFLGNLTGRLIFSLVSFWRIILLVSESLFFLLTCGFFLKGFIPFEGSDPLLAIFRQWPGFILIFLIITAFLTGIKTNYLIKIACGSFIDEKEGISGYLLSALGGSLLGAALSFSVVFPIIEAYEKILQGALVLLPLILIVISILTRLEYSPQTMYARHFEPEQPPQEPEAEHRDDLFFTYLNFSYVIIYFFLGYTTAIKFYGETFHIILYFMVVTLITVSAGYIAGRFLKNAFWYIFSEMLFPLFFLSFIFLITAHHASLPFYLGIPLFAIPSLSFGFTLYQTIKNINKKFDHAKRFKILDFSFIILPFPILIALGLATFTYRWYFVLIYIITLMNIIIPGIYLINRKMEGYKKILYFIFSLVFLPLLIITHVYFEIPLNNDLYLKKIQNFRELKSTNYNAFFIKNRATVLLNQEPIFELKDSTIRNMKRALSAVYLHHALEKPVIFIDSNQKFFRNPIIGYFPHALCIDTLKPENIDSEELPISGKRLYIPDEEYLLNFLRLNKKEFYSIVDIPNIYDQKYFNYRFSEDYYATVKKMHHPRGMYVHMYQLDAIDKTLFKQSLSALDKLYRYHSVYLFANIMIVLNSDNQSSLSISSVQLERLKTQLLQKKSLKYLFLSETHLLSHFLTSSLSDIAGRIPETSKHTYSLLFKDYLKGTLPKKFYTDVTSEKTPIDERISTNKKDFYFRQGLIRQMGRETVILSLIKKTELAETEERYEDETRHLFELKRYTEYNHDLRAYLKQILTYKEDYYFNAAVRLEQEKNWTSAITLYRAILTINANNFDANYRLGLLSLTLQDLDESFKFLKKALKLNSKHPKTLYQMGVLMFSSGRTAEAIDYLNQALRERERSPEVFLYLGLANEKLGKLPDALSYYGKALLEDPNDLTIVSRIDTVKKKMEGAKNKWKIKSPKNQLEEEQDEEIPLPINKSAYDIRLGDTPDKKKQKKQ